MEPGWFNIHALLCMLVTMPHTLTVTTVFTISYFQRLRESLVSACFPFSFICLSHGTFCCILSIFHKSLQCHPNSWSLFQDPVSSVGWLSQGETVRKRIWGSVSSHHSACLSHWELQNKVALPSQMLMSPSKQTKTLPQGDRVGQWAFKRRFTYEGRSSWVWSVSL